MSRRFLSLCALIAIAAVTQRCSSSKGGAVEVSPAPTTGDTHTTPSTSRQANVRGNAMLGAVAGAHVTVYGMDPNTGMLDANASLGAVVTGTYGDYNIIVDANALLGRPFALQMRGGTYVEEASGQTVELGNTAYTTLLPPISTNGNVIAALGPLPDMAYQVFAHQVAAGGIQNTNVATLIANASYQVSQAFGIPDIVGTLPADPNSAIPNDASGQYALILAAISHAASQAGVDSSAMAAAFAATLALDGNLTGLGGGNVTVTDPCGRPLSLMPPSFATLQNTVTSIGNGNIVLPHLRPPAGFTPPTFTSTPPTVAPMGYVPGAPGGFDPNGITGFPATNPNVGANPNGPSNPNTMPGDPNATTSLPDVCATVTYTNYGQNFFASNCLSCHAPGGDGFASIDLTTFADITANQTRIAGQIETGMMPRDTTLAPDVLRGILTWLSCPTLLR